MRLKKLVAMIRTEDTRKSKTSFCIIDAQSVKNASSAEEKGYYAGKKISGIKRHIAVDTNGLPHAIYITTANIGDRAATIEMMKIYRSSFSKVKSVLVDAGYIGKSFAKEVKNLLNAGTIVARLKELYMENNRLKLT